jgi:type VI secretion system protein ImpM
MQSDPLGNFVRRTTLDTLAAMLGLANTEPLRRIILAIGVLMRPILGQGTVSIEKDLVLPLPADDRYRNLVAGLWLYLVTAFLRRTTVEMQVVIERGSERPRLVLGFNGTSPITLLEGLAPETTIGRNIMLIDPEWIDAQAELDNDYGVAKLSAYLGQPAITLELAINTFREVFLGE